MASIQRRLITGVVVVLLGLSTIGTPALAATGNQGYAVYRDGVAGGEWHAAIMDKAHYNTPTYPVIHQPGNGYVRMATWSSFMDGKTYQGTYKPKAVPAVTSEERDFFVYTSRQLKDEQISYDWWAQVQYNSLTTGYWVYPEDITKMRCDGVIEYVYEWHQFRVFGSNAYYDVTWNNLATKAEHQSPFVTPKNQAQNYLTKVTSSLP